MNQYLGVGIGGWEFFKESWNSSQTIYTYNNLILHLSYRDDFLQLLLSEIHPRMKKKIVSLQLWCYVESKFLGKKL